MENKTAKPLLWIGMASIGMAFAGLTSGYVVAKGSLDAKNLWQLIELPNAFYYSTSAILLSSLLLMQGSKALREGMAKKATQYLLFTLALGLAFVVLQVAGWKHLTDGNVWFTGPNSTPAGSWLYVITWFHWMHALAGIIVLSITYYKAQKGAYTPDNHLGYTLGGQFWHFLGLLWIYLLLFLAFLR